MIVAPSLARERQHRKLPAPLVVAFALAVGCPTLSLAQLFSEVTTQVHFVSLLRHSWGNPIWGDFDNDGFLDLIVPTHGLAKSHGPFVYLNNAGITFTDIRATVVSRKAATSTTATGMGTPLAITMATVFLISMWRKEVIRATRSRAISSSKAVPMQPLAMSVRQLVLSNQPIVVGAGFGSITIMTVNSTCL